MQTSTAPTPSADEPPSRLARSEAEAREAGERAYDRFSHSVRLFVETLRFVGFLLVILLGAVYVWVWVLGLVLAVGRVLIGLLMAPLLWLTDGPPHHRGGRPVTAREALGGRLQLWWSRRDEWYRDIARPLGRYLADVQALGRRFWHFTIPRKLAVLLAAVFLFLLPLSYVIPRPHYVQLLDDNVIDYGSGSQPVGSLRYLVHGADLFSTGRTREYLNEDAWWLGKINSQGLKARLQPGRYYKLWVVGIRWWFFPTLYPNIISATEVDRQGEPLAEPSHLMPPQTTGR
ncbi:MAG: hypothetical protein FJW21_13650 [Acidimicrobiia bacterium]|nr:hypothetical protein [Acidimicrobiia bacterium]